MTVPFVIEYIPRRMNELGFSGDYIIRWRHFQVDGKGTLKIDAENEFFMLIEPDKSFTVQSKFGILDLSDTTINEMQYEHRGKIMVTNNSKTPLMILFIQVVPAHTKA